LILDFIEQEVEVQREVSASQIEVEEFIYFLNQPLGRARFSPFDPIFTSTERDNAIAERDNAIAERDNAIAERDNAIAERDNAIAERDNLINSNIWKATKPYRWLRDKF
jgi:hypothetical protein